MSGASTRFAYTVRKQRPEDEDRVLDLLARTVGETRASLKTREFWRWKHESNPFGASYSICAWDEARDVLVGLRTLMWWSLRDGRGDRRKVVRAVDTATHPGYRRKGVFTHLVRRALQELPDEGAEFVFNTPNDRSLPGYLKLGWTKVARLPVHVRPARWSRLPAAAVSRRALEEDALVGLRGWDAFWNDHRDELVDLVGVHERGRGSTGYRTDRTGPFLDWRYGRHPSIRYLVHPVEDAGGLRSVVVGRATPGARGLAALVVTDIFLRKPTPAEGAKALRRLRKATTAHYLVAHFGEGSLEWRALRRAGFLRAPRRGYTLAVRPLATPGTVPALWTDPTRAAGWDLTLSELEIF